MPGKFLNDDLTSVLRAMREDKELSALFLVILGPILIIGIFIIAVTFTCFFSEDANRKTRRAEKIALQEDLAQVKGVGALSGLKFDLYLPKHQVGDLKFLSAAIAPSRPPAADLRFHGLEIYEWQASEHFNPPQSLGPASPADRGNVTIAGEKLLTTENGRTVYVSRSDTQQSDRYYVRIKNTVISFITWRKVSKPFSNEQLKGFCQSLEKADAETLLSMDITHETSKIRSHPEKFITFKPYLPEFLPPGFKKADAVFEAGEDGNPYILLKFEHRVNGMYHDGDLFIYESKATSAFHPPASCGPTNPTSVQQSAGNLIVTTKMNRQIWKDQFKSSHVLLGGTLITIPTFRANRSGKIAKMKGLFTFARTKVSVPAGLLKGCDLESTPDDLGKIVDSMHEVKISDLNSH